MSNSDGQVRINIDDSDVIKATKSLDDYNAAFNKIDSKNFVSQTDAADNVAKELLNTTAKSKTPLQALEQGIRANTQALRNMALSGGGKSEEFKKLAEDTKNWKKTLDDADKTVKNSIGDFNQQGNAMSKLAGAAKGLIGAYIGIQGVRMVINYSAQAVEAFRTQERAILQLENTLQNAGVYTAEYSSHLQQLASEIQNYSNYGDEAVLKAQAMAQAYMGNVKITDELTKATVDFAAATGMDLEQAFNLVGKSVGSQTNALGRYGIELKKGMADAEKMEAIQKQLGERYTGTASKMADSSTQLKNALSDLSEQFGGVLNPAVEKTQNVLLQGVQKLTQWIKQVRILKAEIKDLSIDDLETRYKKNMQNIAELEAGAYNSVMGGNVDIKATIEKKKKEQQEILAQIKQIKAKDKELSQNAKSYKLNDDYGMGVGSLASSGQSKKTKLAPTKVKEATEAVKAAAEVGAYQNLTNYINELTAKLRDLATEGQVGSQVWNEYKSQLEMAQNEQNLINETLKDSGVKIENISQNISSSLSSGIINALRNGGNAFDAFSNLATTALQKVLDKILEMAVVTPILNSITGGIGGGLFSWLGFKDGAAFKNGNVIPFARGGVVNKPTLFSMANGGTGLMGEAGAEAVMPLRRMSNGRLGVEASNGNKAVEVNIYNQSGAQVETRKRDNGSMDIFIRKVNEALSSERTSSGFRSAYAREDRKGIQAV